LAQVEQAAEGAAVPGFHSWLKEAQKLKHPQSAPLDR
jgi:hypothetical protein